MKILSMIRELYTTPILLICRHLVSIIQCIPFIVANYYVTQVNLAMRYSKYHFKVGALW